MPEHGNVCRHILLKKTKNKNEEAAYNRIANNDAGATSCTEGGY